jgi:hypothetical protein
VFQRLPGVFVRGLVIFFFVAYRRGAVCVCGCLVQLGSSLMRIVWHGMTS